MTLLDLQSLKVRYGSESSGLLAVDGVTISVPAGATVGLVGESGCGKSSVARAIVGLAPVVGGRILLDGRDATASSDRASGAFRRRVQMIFQDSSGSLNPRMTVGGLVSEAVRVGDHTATRQQCAARAADLLATVGVARTALPRYPHEFSGGQRQRIAIARALAVKPDLLITDEITSALDVSVQATILNLLRDLQREFRLAYLFISHDLATVHYMSDQVAVMYLGRVVEAASATELFAGGRHPYTKALIESIPRISVVSRPAPLPGDIPDPRHPPSGCRFRTRCPRGPVFLPERRACIDQDPSDKAAAGGHLVACHYPDDAPDVRVGGG